MKLHHNKLACHQQGLMQQLRDFWKEGDLCDVVLKSIDGIEHSAHRTVLSAASAALKALLCAPFREAEQIRQGKPVEMGASSGVVGALLDYIYGGEPDVATMDAVELLRLAGAYGLPCLAEAVEADLRASLDSGLALQLLQETVIWGMPDLRLACEEQVAKDFQQCTLREDFLKLTAKQLQRVLQREDLKVSREEVVVEALLKWGKSSEDRQRDMVLMLCHLDLPSLSSSNLKVLCHAAQSWGPSGADWECEVKQALSLHREESSSEVSRAHRPKRRCLVHWAAGLGASQESDRAGKKVTPTVKDCGFRLAWHEGAFCFNRTEPNQILSCKPGDESFLVVAGQGAPINGFNQLQHIRGLAMLPNGEMIVGHYDAGFENSQLLSFQDGVGKVLLHVPDLFNVCCSPNGVIYVLDAGGTRVQKVEGSRLIPVVDSKDLPEGHKSSYDMFVSKQEVLYITDYKNKRILRFAEGTSVPTVVSDFGDQDGVDLAGLFVTEDERIFICDFGKRRILMTDGGEETSCSELDVSEHGCPQALVVQDGFLNVLVRRNTQEGWEGWVQQFVLPPTLEP